MRARERAKLTPEEFTARLTEIARANPRRKNRVSGDYSCLYTDGDGKHCLIGEFLAIHDPRALPKVGTIDNAQSADKFLESLGYRSDVAALANAIQMEADGCDATWLQSVRTCT
jgi:hypothetical protein